MEKLFIGVDVSKDTFDVCVLTELESVHTKNLVFSNDHQGIKDFIEFIFNLDGICKWVCLEHTGHYGALLTSSLVNNGIAMTLVNPLEIKRSSGLARGKTDPIDAMRIATYAVVFNRSLTPFVLPVKAVEELKTLMAQRELETKVSTMYKNKLKGLKIKHETTDVQMLINICQKSIDLHKDTITQLETAMKNIIKCNEYLMVSYRKITKVIGVGPITAIKCLVETDNFNRFASARKFSCHCGLAPFAYQSGSSVKGKTRTSKHRKKDLKAVLFKAAATAVQHDPQLKSYYKRKLNEGKHKLSVLNAVANKLVLRIFAVAQREEPFVRINQ